MYTIFHLHSRAAEVDILVTDLERANARVAAVERELETAKQSHEVPSFSSQKVKLHSKSD